MIRVEAPCGEMFDVPVEDFHPDVTVGTATSGRNAVRLPGCLFKIYKGVGYYKGTSDQCGLELTIGQAEGDDLHPRSV